MCSPVCCSSDTSLHVPARSAFGTGAARGLGVPPQPPPVAATARGRRPVGTRGGRPKSQPGGCHAAHPGRQESGSNAIRVARMTAARTVPRRAEFVADLMDGDLLATRSRLSATREVLWPCCGSASCARYGFCSTGTQYFICSRSDLSPRYAQESPRVTNSIASTTSPAAERS